MESALTVRSRSSSLGRGKFRISSAGLQFFSRSSGLNVLIDEISYPPDEWALAPRHVSVALLNACDLHCSFCYAPKWKAQLSLETVGTWAIELDRMGCLGLGFGGGEPTLHKQFSEICTFVANETLMAVSFTTHGHHIDRDLAKRLSGNVHFVRLSMDGVGATYERIRGRSFDNFRRALDVVHSFSKFGVNYVVNSQTFPWLDSAVEIACAAGAREFVVLPERPSRETGGLDSKTHSGLLSWIKGYSGKMRLSTSAAGAEGFPVCDPFNLEPCANLL